MSTPATVILAIALSAYLAKRQMSKRARAELQAIYDELGSTRAVAELWGCSKPVAWARLCWHGVSMMPAGGGTPGRSMPDGGPDGKRYRKGGGK